MKIVALDILEDSILAGIDAVALVEKPAIETDFFAFAAEQFAETYTDYPEAAVEAARQGIKRNEEIGNKCATQVGKVRAQQLANREPISLDTVRRMRSFLIRQKGNYELAQERKDYNACGYISYLLWGGPAALPWAEKVLRQAGEKFGEKEDITKTIIEGIIKLELSKFEGLEDACQAGYEAIGLKIKGGRKVPNCVPKTALELEVGSLPNYINELPDDIKKDILKQLKSVGKREEDMLADGFVSVSKDAFIQHAFATIKSSPNKPSSEDFGNYAIRYQYVGPKDSKNRDFCFEMLQDNLLFRKEDINNLSVKGANNEFGYYDIFRYKGSYNCRHFWQEKFYLKDTKVTEAGRSIENVMRTTQAGTINPKARTKGHEQDRAGAGENRIDFAAIDDKQMLVGPLMTPGKLIPRVDEDGDTYYVYFTEDSIKRIAYKAMQDKIIDRVNIEHESNNLVDDVYLVETWLVEDPEKDKSTKYGFSPIKGQWFGVYKVDNDDIWEGYVKPGLVKGFSVEGYFAEQVIKN